METWPLTYISHMKRSRTVRKLASGHTSHVLTEEDPQASLLTPYSVLFPLTRDTCQLFGQNHKLIANTHPMGEWWKGVIHRKKGHTIPDFRGAKYGGMTLEGKQAVRN